MTVHQRNDPTSLLLLAAQRQRFINIICYMDRTSLSQLSSRMFLLVDASTSIRSLKVKEVANWYLKFSISHQSRQLSKGNSVPYRIPMESGRSQ